MRNCAWTFLVFGLLLAAARTAVVLGDVVAVQATDATGQIAGDMGLRTCQLFVQFDDLKSDSLASVGFADITTDDPLGFYQVPAAMAGSDFAPSQIFMDIFPELEADSFVTIQHEVVPLGGNDCTTADPDFDSLAFNTTGQVTGGWYCNNPPAGQGAPYQNGLVRIAQFTVGDSYNISGNATLFWFVDYFKVYEHQFSFECFAASCPADLTGDGVVNASDLGLFLGGGWGPNPGHPGDFNGDDVIDAADLALMLGSWGPC